jgi:hypothetical protein
MATPQTGSQRVLTPLSWLSKDFYALKPHGDFVTGLQDTLVNNRVVLDDKRAQSGDIIIPTWAVLGASDHWVDKLSAGLNLPDARKRMVRGSHQAIVKPQSKQSDAYQFVRDRIQEVDIQRRFAADPAPSQPSLPWSPLADAFEDGKPHYFKLLRWNYRLVETLFGREHDLEENSEMGRKQSEHAEGGQRAFSNKRVIHSNSQRRPRGFFTFSIIRRKNPIKQGRCCGG